MSDSLPSLMFEKVQVIIKILKKCNQNLEAIMDGFYLVFAYGTLKKGEPNDVYLHEPQEGRATFLGHARTLKKYPLIVATDYNIPYVLSEEGKGMEVEGEVYEVDDKVLARLDILENHPEWYRREQISALLYQDEDGNAVVPPKEIVCWIYLMHDFKDKLLNLKFYQCYHNISDDHGLYVPAAKRTSGLPRQQIKKNQ